MGNKQVKLGCVTAPIEDGQHPRDRVKSNIHHRHHHHHQKEHSSTSTFSNDTITTMSTASSASSASTQCHPHCHCQLQTHSQTRSASSPPPYIPSENEEECALGLEEEEVYYPYYKMNVKILFLDVDGVLNNKFTKWDETENGLDDKLLKYLKLILLKTGCKIVLSTTWRLNENAKQILLHSFKTRLDINIDDIVIGQTRDLKYKGKHRTDEIYDYLKRNDYRFNVISWCALDDLSLDKFDLFSRKLMYGHFIKTNPKIGISPQNALSAIDILNAYDYQQNPYLYQRASYYS